MPFGSFKCYVNTDKMPLNNLFFNAWDAWTANFFIIMEVKGEM